LNPVLHTGKKEHEAKPQTWMKTYRNQSKH